MGKKGVKGGVSGAEEIEEDETLWILNDGCEMENLASRHLKSFFIPILKEIDLTHNSDNSEVRLRFIGSVLIPCSLEYRIEMKSGNSIQKELVPKKIPKKQKNTKTMRNTTKLNLKTNMKLQKPSLNLLTI